MTERKLRFSSSFVDLNQIPKDWWQSAAQDSIFLSRWWFETVIEAALDEDDEVTIGYLEHDDQPAAVLPFRVRRRSTPFGWREYRSLTSPYSCLFHPLIADKQNERSIARSLGEMVGRQLGANDRLALDAFDGNWTALEDFAAGLAASGQIVECYEHFGNWYEPISGRSFAQYFRSRDGRIQEIRRRKMRLATQIGVEFEIVSNPSSIEVGIRDYQTVYLKSWKAAEPYGNFLARLIEKSAAHGALRLGICRLKGVPIAAQLWTVWNRRATIMKLAHDEKFAQLSIGTLLTAYMMNRLIEEDAVAFCDFGRGDDSYKRLWCSERNQMIGIASARRHSLMGSAQIARRKMRVFAGKLGYRPSR